MKVRWGARIVILTDSPSAGVRARAMGRGKSARRFHTRGVARYAPARDGFSVAVFTRALLTAFQLRSVHRPGGGTRMRDRFHTRGVARYAPTRDGFSVSVFIRALLTAFQLHSVHRPGGGTRVHARSLTILISVPSVSLWLSLPERSLRHFGFAQCIAPLNDRKNYASERGA